MRKGLLFSAKAWREQKETAEFFFLELTVRKKKNELDNSIFEPSNLGKTNSGK
jgi:hypothetical protein